MKVKTSITLTENLLRAIDAQETFKNRSDFLEQAARRLLAHVTREAMERKDMELINRHADKLNAEAEDTLAYQVPL